MTDLYHQKDFRVAFVSPSANLFGKSQKCLRSRLGVRAHLTPYVDVREAQREILGEERGFEMVALDASAIPTLAVLPQFLGAGHSPLPVLLLFPREEMKIAELAMEAGYKALLFTDDDTEFLQLFPAMTLRIITQFRGEQKRRKAAYLTSEEQTASDLGVSDQVLAPKKFPHTRFFAWK